MSRAILLAAVLAAPWLPTSLPAQTALTDAQIVAIFDQANTADIETGQLAADRAHAKAVRELGQQFADAHRAVRAQGLELARKLGVTPALPPGDRSAAEHREVMARLRQHSGPAFDRAFLDHEIAFHQAVIDAVTSTLLPAIQNPELKAFIEKVAPAFRGHLQMAQELRQKLAASR
jgi:putative membrane protein